MSSFDSSILRNIAIPIAQWQSMQAQQQLESPVAPSAPSSVGGALGHLLLTSGAARPMAQSLAAQGLYNSGQAQAQGVGVQK